MKILKTLSALTISAAMLFSVSVLNVSAATTAQDGLEVSLTTDKSNYSKDEKITATLSIKNNNLESVKNISMQNILPDDFQLSDDSAANKSLVSLNAGETLELKTTLIYSKTTDEESSQDESSREESSKEESSKEESSKEESSKEESSKEESSTEESSKEESSKEESSKEESSKEESSREESSKEESSTDESTKEESSKDIISQNESSYDQSNIDNSIHNGDNSDTSKTIVNPSDTVKTGDNISIVLLLTIAVIVSFVVTVSLFKRKKGKQFLSIILCLGITSTAIFISGKPSASATNDERLVIELAETITIDGNTVSIIGRVYYEKTEKPVPIPEQIKTYSNGDTVYKPTDDNIKYDENENVIYYNNLILAYTYDDLSSEEASELAESINGAVAGDISGAVNLLQIVVNESDVGTLQRYADKLMESDKVMLATYDVPMEISEDSMNDNNPWSEDGAIISDKGNERNPDGNDWWAEAIGAYTAWNYTKYASPIKVGVIDNGFMLNHEDLQNVEMLSPNYTENTSALHGTHVAGLIGASNNGLGLRGVSDSAKVICADYTPKEESFYTEENSNKDLIHTGEYIEITKQMVESGVQVINNSWNTGKIYTKNWYIDNNTVWSISYEDYLQQKLSEKNIQALNCMMMMISFEYNGYKNYIIFQSAGNGFIDYNAGNNAKYNGAYCSIDEYIFNRLSDKAKSTLNSNGINYQSIKDHIIIVGAVENQRDIEGNYYMTSFSNYGDNVDICAPGDDIFSTNDYSNVNTKNKYIKLSGTSMSTPIVTGSAALVWSLDPSLTAGEVKDTLIKTSKSRALSVSTIDTETIPESYPMLNVGKAVKYTINTRDVYKFKANGKVVDKNNNPLSQATIKIYALDSDYPDRAGTIQQEITSSENGGFSFVINKGFSDTNLYQIEVSKNGYETYTDTFTIYDKTHDFGNIGLEDEVTEGTVSGRIVDSNTQNLSGVNINIKNGTAIVKQLNSTDGTFSVKLGFGNYSFEFSKNGYESKTVSVNLTDKTYVMDMVKLEDEVTEGTVNGRIVDSNTQNLSGVNINIKNGTAVVKQLNSTDGTFSVKLGFGNYTFEFSKDGYESKTVSVNLTDKTYVMDIVKLKKDSYKEDFINALLSSVDQWNTDYEFTFVDLDFDGKLEFLIYDNMDGKHVYHVYSFSDGQIQKADADIGARHGDSLYAYYSPNTNAYKWLSTAETYYYSSGSELLTFETQTGTYYGYILDKGTVIIEEANEYTYNNGHIENNCYRIETHRKSGSGANYDWQTILEGSPNLTGFDKLNISYKFKCEPITSGFVNYSVFESYSESQRRTVLESAYDSFSYQK